MNEDLYQNIVNQLHGQEYLSSALAQPSKSLPLPQISAARMYHISMPAE